MADRALLDAADVVSEEARLLTQVSEGDLGEPLSRLYRRYERPVYGVGLGMLGDRGLAEELVQETFIRLWRHAAKYDPARGSVQCYVFGIARRAAIDLYRRPSSRPHRDTEAIDLPVEDLAEQTIDRVVVQDALGALSPDHRDVLELFYRHGLTQPQVAERLGIPHGTVKSRIYHALRTLRSILEEAGHEPS